MLRYRVHNLISSCPILLPDSHIGGMISAQSMCCAGVGTGRVCVYDVWDVRVACMYMMFWDARGMYVCMYGVWDVHV